ncbi:RNA polymerase sigma factor [Rhodovulum sp. 12E13]|uniref:RNA polymerase sigma factor n=1 Tax=Rhodovulum sp. 12E13 TaxID=2203891 RepID=UPI000E17A293|nr:RNA polymerase sigma factor [Rhodovulum sp. 12E13]RDC68039.1 RNA polymerase sigma factor [Rhodovulum sp. 12E13]
MGQGADGRSASDRDADLLAAYAAGEAHAARALLERLGPRVLALATRMLGDRAEAEDVTQEAMLRLWRQAPRWRDGEAKVSTWLTRVALNLATDRLRRRRGVPLDTAFGEGAEPADGRPGVEAGLRAAERAAALRTALAELPERQAQAVALRHLEGLSNPEIAAVMALSVEAVESLTARGRRALAARLGERRGALTLEDGDD